MTKNYEPYGGNPPVVPHSGTSIAAAEVIMLAAIAAAPSTAPVNVWRGIIVLSAWIRLAPVTNETIVKRIAAHSEAVRTLPVKAESVRYRL